MTQNDTGKIDNKKQGNDAKLKDRTMFKKLAVIKREEKTSSKPSPIKELLFFETAWTMLDFLEMASSDLVDSEIFLCDTQENLLKKKDIMFLPLEKSSQPEFPKKNSTKQKPLIVNKERKEL